MPVTDLDSFLASFDGEPGYLDWAAFGPLSPAVRSEAQGDTELLGSGRRTSIELVADHVREARELVAELIGTDAAQVVLQPSTTYGLMHADLRARGRAHAEPRRVPEPDRGRDPRRGGPRLDPAAVARAGGRVHDTGRGARSALTDDTRAVAVSLVDFRTGYRADLSALREVIGDRLLIVDAIQGFGVVEADYPAADVVCGNGYKWLRAGRGTGFAWFGERALERIAPVLSGFGGVDGDLPVDVVPPPSASAQAFTVTGRRHARGRAARDGAARGRRRRRRRRSSRSSSARAADVMFFADRYEVPVVTPREPERRAGIVTLEPAPQDAAPLAASLANHGLTVTARAGRIRVAPHVGTGADTLRLFGDALAAFSSARVW